MSVIENCQIIELPRIFDARGNLTFVEDQHLPFKMKRVFWIYDVPGGEVRGGHAYRTSEEFVICLSGSMEMLVNDGNKRVMYTLNRSYYGLYIPHCIWRQMINFSTNSVVLVLSSTEYNHDDYIYNFDEFLSLREDMTRWHT